MTTTTTTEQQPPSAAATMSERSIQLDRYLTASQTQNDKSLAWAGFIKVMFGSDDQTTTPTTAAIALNELFPDLPEQSTK